MDESEGYELESFEPGDVVAILNNGTVTKNTNLDCVQFVSVVPGEIDDPISPWKIFPDPPPKDIENYQAVMMLGIAYVKVETTKSSNFCTKLVIPSGNGDGQGSLIEKLDIDDEGNKFSLVVGLPIDDSTTINQSYPNQHQILIARNGQIYQPVISALLSKLCSLTIQTDKNSQKIEQLTDKVQQLEKQMKSMDHTLSPPKDIEVRFFSFYLFFFDFLTQFFSI